jgi:uncharacterized protein YpmB
VTNVKKIIIIILIIVLIVIGISSCIYLNAVDPIDAAQEKAVKMAKEESDLQEIEDFSVYNGEETYYVIKGKNQYGTGIYIWIPEKKGRIIVRKQSDGISKKEAVDKLMEEKNPTEIISVRLGMEKNIPLWEIYYRSEGNLINYYYVDFKTGEWLKKIENL